MSVSELALVQGMRDTKLALARWNAAPLKILKPWIGLSVAITGGLLLSVYAIAKLSTPDPTRYFLPGLHDDATGADYLHVLYRNSLVLALHAAACVAGYIAGTALPAEAERHRGLSGWVHRHAGPAAIAFVSAATLFSLVTQAYVLGSGASTLAQELHIGQATLMLTLLPHALPELTALFLPLAAWLVASRRRRFDELLAATVATTALAIPVLVVTAAVEIWVWPQLLRAASPLG